MELETLIERERKTRAVLDMVVENLSTYRRDVPAFNPVPEEYYGNLDKARAEWHQAYYELARAEWHQAYGETQKGEDNV